MANIVVTEFGGIGSPKDKTPAASRLIASQVVAIGATSASTTNALNVSTTLIRVFAEADCYATFGAGTLDAEVSPQIAMAADSTEYFSVHEDSGFKVACIERTVA
jgi:formate-dependent phosphoribosylglycinamide formyltransferase (GAR transformylase)